MKSVSVTVKWDNMKINSIQNNVLKGLLRMGYDIANLARQNAPYKTGALSNSIRVEEDAGIVTVIAGGKAGNKEIRYAAIQEFGGRAGKNHSVSITGKHYMRNAKDFVMAGNYIKKYFGGVI